MDAYGLFALMRKEEERRQTFALGGWPFEFSSPSSMAENGFFHCLLGNVVQCAFCQMVVSPWTFAREPKSVQINESPMCPFIQGNGCGNIPVPNDPLPDLDRNTTCLLCLEAQRSVLFKPCNHFACCSCCAARQRDCPVCRSRVVAQMKIKLQ